MLDHVCHLTAFCRCVAHYITKISTAGLSGFALFVSISGMLLSTFMLLVPVVYEKYDKLIRLARALKEIRVGFILVGAGTAFSLLIAYVFSLSSYSFERDDSTLYYHSFITTISAWTQAGCKKAANDPNADKGDDFTKGLDGWCSTKKAGAIFFWLAFGQSCSRT